MSIQITVDYASQTADCPTLATIQIWVEAALKERVSHASLSIKILDEDEMMHLNATYRNKEKATNVLSFACQLPDPIRGDVLGDIAICAPIVEKEAKAQNKDLTAHWSHLIIHGVLHLLGFDHETEDDAVEMETIETNILLNLGFVDPYQEVLSHE